MKDDYSEFINIHKGCIMLSYQLIKWVTKSLMGVGQHVASLDKSECSIFPLNFLVGEQ